MTPERESKFRALAEAATAGPWVSEWNVKLPDNGFDETVAVRSIGVPKEDVLRSVVVGALWWDGLTVVCRENDAAFIAAARAGMIEALDAVREERQKAGLTISDRALGWDGRAATVAMIRGEAERADEPPAYGDALRKLASRMDADAKLGRPTPHGGPNPVHIIRIRAEALRRQLLDARRDWHQVPRAPWVQARMRRIARAEASMLAGLEARR